MKQLKLQFHVCTLFTMILLFAACGGEEAATQADHDDDSASETAAEATVAGEWKLVNFESDGSSDKFKECDAQTTWNFTDEEDGALDDGTATKKMVATAPDDCKFFGFNAKWTRLPDGQLFISTTRVGGTGGASNAGLFNVQELTDDKMVLKSFSNIYTFQR